MTFQSPLRRRLPHLRLHQMAAHVSPSDPRLSFSDIPKTHVFTAKLPPDAAFVTPLDSHKAPRESLGPRLVKGALFTYVRPEPAKGPELLAVSPAALRDIGLGEDAGKTEEFKEVVSGNKILGWDEGTGEGVYPWAQCYGGFQFGSWAGQLGDGRAISLFEATNPVTNVRYEIQLKGAGKTPYSRFADGKAVLRSSIREFIVSEALHALSIPTTRALSLILLPHCKVRRERLETGAIVTRFAQSWLRIGTFDILRARGDRRLIRKLSTYVAEDVFGGWENLPAKLTAGQNGTDDIMRGVPERDVEGGPGEEENRFARLYREIVRRNAKTVAAWQAYGFTNGVLNTDNTSLYGLSIDFGPFAFLDNFDPNYTPNHDDHMLRYSYRNQTTIIWWNLVRLGESLAGLFGAGRRVDNEEFIEKGVQEGDADELVKRAEGIINRAGEEYKAVFLAEYKRLMTSRLGLQTHMDEDPQTLFSELLDTMSNLELDFNNFFRKLASVRLAELESEEGRKKVAGRFFHHEGPTGVGITEELARKRISDWLAAWRVRALRDWGEGGDGEREVAMKAVNPKVREPLPRLFPIISPQTTFSPS
jgi:uncharacterized protein YdiU (UPF0061 family)